MANIKITDLPELSETPNDANLLEIVDKASETPTSKKITWANIKAAVWTEATGTGAPVRANSPILVTPALGTPASGDLQNCTAATATTKGVVELDTDAEAVTGTDTERALTAANLKAVLGHDYTYPIQEIVEYSEAQ